jgi:aryl-alcohol dehydrogenase-like predicted oxidoreductase
MAMQLDLAVTPWDTLGSGVLTGKYNRDPALRGRAALRDRIKARDLAISEVVVKIAEEIGRTPAQVALDWVRQGRGVIVPLVGARTREQLDDNLGCLEFQLTPEQKTRLDEASAIELGFPHDFLAQFQSDRILDHRA